MTTRTVPLTESRILRSYAEKTPGSKSWHARAKKLLPDGVTHVGRYLEPHPVYIERAAGSRKWDVDGNEYIDYLGGHGALILGHSHPAVLEAVTAQAWNGAHYGACHALELEWAELVQQLVPSAERVRFTVTGTEATHLALRVSRAFTGKNKIIRFAGHFHGWHDHVCFPPGGAPGVIAVSWRTLWSLCRMTSSKWSTGSVRVTTSRRLFWNRRERPSDRFPRPGRR
jgi:glutamate-1-semialdehyde 2,1-aminomutase